MKNLKLMISAVVLLGTLFSLSAQTKVVSVYPKHGTVVTKIYKPKKVVFKKANFHFAKGVWYKKRGRNYVVCAAPVGIKVRTLPRGNKVVKVKGRKLYKYKGIWYKKKRGGFVVVTV